MSPGGPFKRPFRLGEGERIAEEVDDEVRFHLERKVERLRAEGLDEEEARAEALRRFGDLEEVKREMSEETRRHRKAAGPAALLDRVRQDVAYALRQLARQPGFALVAVLTLALGIGATTGVFSVVDGILFRPLPYPEPGELIVVWQDLSARGGPVDEWSNYPDLYDLREGSRTIAALGMWGGGAPTLTGRGEPEQLVAAYVSEAMFSEVLRVPPAVGRDFGPEEDRWGAAGTVILSHGLWRRAFGGERSAVGSSVLLDGVAYTVIGVMPQGFTPPFQPRAELWLPLRWDLADNGCPRGNACIRSVARLAEGATLEEARREADDVARRLEERFPGMYVDQGFNLQPLRGDMVAAARPALLTLMGAAGFVLLMACVNLANILLARGTSRRSELAVRSALGAGRPRVVAQLVTESVVLAVVGGAVGVSLAFLLTDALVALAPPGTPRIDAVAVNGRILAFAAVASVLAGLLFGVLPALRSVGKGLHDALGDAGRGGVVIGGARAREALVVAQVALALVLLVGAGLLVRSFQNLRALELGFRPEGVLTMRVSLPRTYEEDFDEVRAFYAELIERLAALPGVEGAGAVSALPLAGLDSDVGFSVEGRPSPPPGQAPIVWYRRVTPGYMAAMGMRVLRGRGVLPTDRAAAPPVVVVNETFVRRHFPDEDPLGQRINLGSSGDPTWREIVGVAADVRHFGLRGDSRPSLYLPFDQAASTDLFVVLKSGRETSALAGEARGALAEMDPLLAAGRVAPLDSLVGAAMGPERLVALLVALFAGLALLLAVIGLYGVVSYGVNTRLREMGVRLALGASGAAVGALVMRRTLTLVALGATAGLAGALGLGELLDALLFGVGATDPLTFAAAAVLLMLVAAAAAAIPARRAARVDPMRVLKAQ